MEVASIVPNSVVTIGFTLIKESASRKGAVCNEQVLVARVITTIKAATPAIQVEVFSEVSAAPYMCTPNWTPAPRSPPFQKAH